MTPRSRLLRFAGGIALVLLGVVIFYLSDTYDPHNRLAVVSVVALVIGGSLTSQGIRGRHDGPLYKEEPVDTGPAVDTGRTVLALALGWATPEPASAASMSALTVLQFRVMTSAMVVLCRSSRSSSLRRKSPSVKIPSSRRSSISRW